eukprot:10822909-Lingulodinium_polyedra.AAC.1
MGRASRTTVTTYNSRTYAGTLAAPSRAEDCYPNKRLGETPEGKQGLNASQRFSLTEVQTRANV